MTTFDLELPGVYVDALYTSSLALPSLYIGNRVPEPNEVGVPLTSDVSLVVGCIDPAGAIDLTATKVYVNGILAYDGSSGTPFQTGWNSANSVVTAVGTNAYSITLGHVGAFNSQSTVSVRVVSKPVGGGLVTIDQTYTFTTADLTAPAVIGAVATAQKTVRVTFSEPMRAAAATVVGSPLNPANYSILPLEAPAVTPTVVSVTAVSSTVFELTTDTELSMAKSHKLTVVNAQDVDGNAVVAPLNTATFVSFQTPQPAGRLFNVFKMLPLKNRREDADNQQTLARFAAVLQDVVDLLLASVDSFGDIIDPDVADEQYVDAMLEDMGNPFTFVNLSLIDKRRLARVLVPIYKQKGTTPGVKNVVRFFLGIEVDVVAFTDGTMQLGVSQLGVNWVLGPDGSWRKYAFNVTTFTPTNPSGLVLTDDQRKRLNAIVEYMKPAHTHFVQLLETVVPPVVNHLSLGQSQLGVNWTLH